MTPTDAELLRRSGSDPTAYRELYDRHAERVAAFLERRTRDRDAALDLTAETFAQAWLSRHRFDDQHAGSCGPWLFGIARHLLLRSVREQRLASDAARRLHLTVDRATVPPADAWVEGLEEDLHAALAELPEGQRRAVQLRVLDDLPYDRVADDLAISPGAARIRVSRGLAALRVSLSSTDRSTP
ncbi:RNA polymerase sigma-70 factor (ECF subfamily) [Motilibacter rhizosphaerae]|uniref:RNA polymerase sigma-70 factor (ECF subfamily) n=1 Tax=Motilibacter rhizosphaerae TaxID=598652 RepID=A0A4V2F4A3_9ACTN|nr:sigma-70 family RNA polymerase sigma factor [Motilibacter rhizosphaerae]RZS86907.1 RNA polymerase sigma-70 factor (ECF subfamily) [Motilibacter rhizosphaerae]